jgi:hypothetical protein
MATRATDYEVRQKVHRLAKELKKDTVHDPIAAIVYINAAGDGFICNGNEYTTTADLKTGEGLVDTDIVIFIGELQDLVVDSTP